MIPGRSRIAASDFSLYLGRPECKTMVYFEPELYIVIRYIL